MFCHEIMVMIDSFIEQAGFRTMHTTIPYDVNFITSRHRHRKNLECFRKYIKKLYVFNFSCQIDLTLTLCSLVVSPDS